MLRIVQALKEFCSDSKEELNRIDGLQGDGDLGVTVELVGKSIYEAAKKTDSLKDWFTLAGTTVRKQAPSTIGVLTSFALSAAGRSLDEEAILSPQTFVKVQQVMIDEIKKRGDAQLGDRTLLDAFIPASEAFARSLQAGTSGLEALAAAVAAAKQGADQTRAMAPKTGRSSWVGARVVGEVDGGAWLCYQVYQVIYNTLQTETQS